MNGLSGMLGTVGTKRGRFERRQSSIDFSSDDESHVSRVVVVNLGVDEVGEGQTEDDDDGIAGGGDEPHGLGQDLSNGGRESAAKHLAPGGVVHLLNWVEPVDLLHLSHQEEDDATDEAQEGVLPPDGLDVVEDVDVGAGDALHVRGVGDLEAEETLDLRGCDCDGGGGGEPGNHRHRDKINNKSCRQKQVNITFFLTVSFSMYYLIWAVQILKW